MLSCVSSPCNKTFVHPGRSVVWVNSWNVLGRAIPSDGGLNRSMVPPMHLLRFEASHHELDGRIEFPGLEHGEVEGKS